MGYVIDRYGNKEKVNMDTHFSTDKVALVDEDLILRTKYLIQICKSDNMDSDRICDLVAEKEVDKYPTDEQIIYYMMENEVNMNNGYATIAEIKVIDFKEDNI